MDEFRTAFGDLVDLDDPDTYCSEQWQIYEKVYELRAWAWAEIGKSIVYMNFMHKHDESDIWESQRKRVYAFAERFAEEFHNLGADTPENRLWWRKFIYRFLDEVENQC